MDHRKQGDRSFAKERRSRNEGREESEGKRTEKELRRVLG